MHMDHDVLGHHEDKIHLLSDPEQAVERRERLWTEQRDEFLSGNYGEAVQNYVRGMSRTRDGAAVTLNEGAPPVPGTAEAAVKALLEIYEG